MTIETKYSIGETVLFFRNNQVNEGVIIGIITRTGYGQRDEKMAEGNFYYLKCGGYDTDVSEPKLFPTKEALLQSL